MKKSLILFFTLLVYDSCIDRLDVITPNSNFQLVVDGSITDAPGPYTVKLSRTRKLVDFSPTPTVLAKSVTILDDAGNSEILTETTTDVFQTSPTGLRGVIGRKYFVKIELQNGKIYESIPEEIKPAGTVDSVYYEFEQSKSVEGIDKYHFRIFMDSEGASDGENLFLWKLTGTYKVITSPELHFVWDPDPKKDPRPCSGFVLDKSDNQLQYVKPCECCQCWASLVDEKPNVSDNYVIANGMFKKIDMGVIPVEFWHFWEKTLVKVEQLSLSRAAFNYWKTVQDQKEGATSLFQPAIGKAFSNVFLKNGNEEVQGFFYAAGTSKKLFFLTVKDIPLGPGIIPPPPALPPRAVPKPGEPYVDGPFFSIDPFVIRESCLFAFKHSTTQRPADWK